MFFFRPFVWGAAWLADRGAFSSSSLLAGCSEGDVAPSLLMMRSTSVGLATSVSEWTAGGCPGIVLHRLAPPGAPPVPFLVWQAGAGSDASGTRCGKAAG